MEQVVTTNHDEIRMWIEEHGGQPAIKEKRGMQRGVIDIVFDEYDGEHQIISWEEFFDTFDSLKMEFCYEKANGEGNQFSYSFINQDEHMENTSVENEMPEDDVPVENVIPSAPIRESPDSLNSTTNYDIA